MSREIEVWADWQELGSPILMGHLRSSLTRGKAVFSFSYEGEWLASGAARQLDPDLRLFGGSQYLNSGERPNFGLFLDSSPDRWGRLLMQRQEPGSFLNLNQRAAWPKTAPCPGCSPARLDKRQLGSGDSGSSRDSPDLPLALRVRLAKVAPPDV